MQYGPASTREKSATSKPDSGPAGRFPGAAGDCSGTGSLMTAGPFPSQCPYAGHLSVLLLWSLLGHRAACQGATAGCGMVRCGAAW